MSFNVEGNIRMNSDKKKYPRLFLAHSDDNYEPINGVYILWPKGGKSQVLGLSFAGVVVSSQGILDVLKVQDYIVVQLLLPTPDQKRIPLNLRLIKKTSRVIQFSVDSNSSEGRIKIEQVLKDNIIKQTLKPLTANYSWGANGSPQIWLHGAFDTNLFIWMQNQDIKQFIIEYENILLFFDGTSLKTGRSTSTCDEVQGYVSSFFDKSFVPQKLSLGKSWLLRVSKILSEQNDPQIKPLLQILDKHKNLI